MANNRDFDRDYNDQWTDQDRMRYERWRSGNTDRGYDRTFDNYDRNYDRGYDRNFGGNMDRTTGNWDRNSGRNFGNNGYNDRNNMGWNDRSYDRGASYDWNRNTGAYGNTGNFGYDRNYGTSGQGYQGNQGYQGYQNLGGSGPNGGIQASTSGGDQWNAPGPYTGMGPQNYKRSDETIRDDVCHRLTQHGHIDARNIDVSVHNGEVTLKGSVDQRQMKRTAEDVAESVAGVHDVHNQIQVNRNQQTQGTQTQETPMSGKQTTTGQNQRNESMQTANSNSNSR